MQLKKSPFTIFYQVYDCGFAFPKFHCGGSRAHGDRGAGWWCACSPRSPSLLLSPLVHPAAPGARWGRSRSGAARDVAAAVQRHGARIWALGGTEPVQAPRTWQSFSKLMRSIETSFFNKLIFQFLFRFSYLTFYNFFLIPMSYSS